MLPKMIEIDWSQLRKNSNSKEISFEKFCFQVASAKFGEYGQFTYPYNMTGSEFYLELKQPLQYEGMTYPIGTEILWQAKYWVNQNDLDNTKLGKDRRQKLAEEFRNTYKEHPRMTLWIVCTPGMVKENAYKDLKAELSIINPNIGVSHWHKNVFESFFLEDESKYRGITAFFFGKYNLNNELVLRITSATIESLKKKFDFELHTDTSFERQLMSMVDTKTADGLYKEKLQSLSERLENYNKHWTTETKKRRRSVRIPEKVLKAFEDYESYLLKIAGQLVAVLPDDELDVLVCKSIEIIEEAKKRFDIIAQNLTNAIQSEGEFEQESLFDYYAKDILEIKDIIFSGRARRMQSVEYALSLRTSSYFPVFAQAGHGKTHFACAIANKLILAGQPVLLLTGDRFKHYASPQEVILKLFELDGKLQFDELIGALDCMAACFPNARMPIIIDSLNESFPSDVAWKTDLPLMLTSIKKAKHLFLITTCRDKTDYIQRIYGLTSYEEVDNHILLKGIETQNLAETIRKYFTKYNISSPNIINKQLFKNPLLLKIFCETNRETSGLVVNDYSLAECMKNYSNRLVDNIARGTKGVVDKMVKHHLQHGLKDMGKLLWERNTRSLDYFDDFCKIFNERTDNLIEEGVCFQVDLKDDNSEVKFTYDLLAGYHIAKYILDSTKDATELRTLLNKKDVFCKLFGNTGTLHTLSEDIIKSLVYLVAERENIELFELVPEDAALSKILGNLDFICGSEKGRISLEKKLELPLGEELKKRICELVKEKVQNEQSVFGISSILPAFLQMNTEELDMLFHSIFLEYGAMEYVAQCIRKHLQEDMAIDDALATAFLFTGTFVHEKRQGLIKLITLFAEKRFVQYFTIATKMVKIQDPFIREAVYIATTGAAVRNGKKWAVDLAINLLTEDLRVNPTSHIVMLDLLETLMEYAISHFSTILDKSVLYLSKNTTWPKSVEKLHSNLYEYDFEKYHLRPYSSLPYASNSPYSSDDMWYMIVKRMRDNGFNDEAYSQREKELSDNSRFLHEAVGKMACKHRDTTQKELVGWLLLNDYIVPKYKNTMRTPEIEIDPSYPVYSPLRCLDTHSYLCKNPDDMESWLKANPISRFENKLCTILPKSSYRWVLLKGYISQRNEEREKGCVFYWSVDARLNRIVRNSFMVENIGSSPSHLYAFEIGWRKMESSEGEYCDPSLGLPLLNKYNFSAWDHERDAVASFYFINEEICQEMNLEFSLKDLCYYRQGEKVVEVFKSSSSSFFYLRQDVMEEIIKKYKAHLYFELYVDKTILKGVDRSSKYKYFKKVVKYENIYDSCL